VATRCLVYDQLDDAGLAGTVKQAGAFYEHYNRLAASLPSYVTAELPSNDRRDPGTTDRRHTPRGGRRSSDSPAS